MEFTVNLDQVVSGRVPGMAINFLGHGWLERSSGVMLHDPKLRVTVYLNDDEARKAIDWIVENKSHAFPFNFPDANRIVGVELVEAGRLAPV